MTLDVRNSKNIKITVTKVDENKPAMNNVVVNKEEDKNIQINQFKEERTTGMVSQAMTINKSFLGSPPVKSIPGRTLILQLQEELRCNQKKSRNIHCRKP